MLEILLIACLNGDKYGKKFSHPMYQIMRQIPLLKLLLLKISLSKLSLLKFAREIRRHICVFMLAVGLVACAQNPADKMRPADLGVVKVVTAPGRITNIESVSTLPFQWDAVGRGALSGAIPCLRLRPRGGKEMVLVQWLSCFSISALVGAISGAVSEPSPQSLEVDDLTAFFAVGRHQALLNKYVAHYAVDAGVDAQIPFAHPDGAPLVKLRQADSHIEVWVKKITLDYVSNGRNPRVSVAFDMDVSIRRRRDDTVLRQFQFSLQSAPEVYHYWFSDNYAYLQHFIEEAAQKLASQVFLR